MDCTKIIGEKIKALRTAQEITLEELAERTGLSKEQIESIEQNINIPSLAPLVKSHGHWEYVSEPSSTTSPMKTDR